MLRADALHDFPNSNSSQPHLLVLAAQCVRGLLFPSATARGDGAAGGARAPAGTLGGGINVPTSHGKAPCAPKAGAAPPGAPPTQASGRPGAPRFGRSVRARIASRKRARRTVRGIYTDI